MMNSSLIRSFGIRLYFAAAMMWGVCFDSQAASFVIAEPLPDNPTKVVWEIRNPIECGHMKITNYYKEETVFVEEMTVALWSFQEGAEGTRSITFEKGELIDLKTGLTIASADLGGGATDPFAFRFAGIALAYQETLEVKLRLTIAPESMGNDYYYIQCSFYTFQFKRKNDVNLEEGKTSSVIEMTPYGVLGIRFQKMAGNPTYYPYNPPNPYTNPVETIRFHAISSEASQEKKAYLNELSFSITAIQKKETGESKPLKIGYCVLRMIGENIGITTNEKEEISEIHFTNLEIALTDLDVAALSVQAQIIPEPERFPLYYICIRLISYTYIHPSGKSYSIEVPKYAAQVGELMMSSEGADFFTPTPTSTLQPESTPTITPTRTPDATLTPTLPESTETTPVKPTPTSTPITEATPTITPTPTFDGVNHPPVAMADYFDYSPAFKNMFSVNPLLNDSDPDPFDTIFLKSVLWDNTSPFFTVRAHPEARLVEIQFLIPYDGLLAIPYTIADKQGAESSNIIFLRSIKPYLSGNHPPTANPDECALPVGGEIEISPLSNDWDIDGDEIHLTAVNDYSSSGEIEVRAYDSVWYKPREGFSGKAHIVYSIRDTRGAIAIGHVTYHVKTPEEIEAAKPPVASNYHQFCNSEETTEFSFESLLVNDIPLAVDPFLPKFGEVEFRRNPNETKIQVFAPQFGTIRLGPKALAAPSGLDMTDLRRDSLSVSIAEEPVKFEYVPAANFLGRDHIVYRFESAPGLSSMGTIHIDVGDAGTGVTEWMMY